MNDAILTRTDRQEALSRVYVAAVAAGAGYTLATQDFDRDGVDVQVRAGGDMLPSLDIQLKATTQLGAGQDDEYSYALRRRNYDLLRVETLVPRILVVLDLPKNEADWISISPEELIMRRSVYWVALAGCPVTTNKETVTISIKKQNRFDIEGLKDLMNRARTGAL